MAAADEASCKAPFAIWDGECVLPAEESFDARALYVIKFLVGLLVVSSIYNYLSRLSVLRTVASRLGGAIATVAKKVNDRGVLRRAASRVKKQEQAMNRDMSGAMTQAEKIRSESIPAIASGKEHFLRATSEGLLHKEGLTKLHKDFVIGVGLPLFYNAHTLPFVAALLGMYLLPKMPEGGADAEEFSLAMFHALLRLYVLMLVHALITWKLQLKFASWFLAQNATMCDYVIELTGIPSWMISEKDLLKSIQDHQVIDDAVGVSIAYDIRKNFDDVINPMFETNLALQEHLSEDIDDDPDRDFTEAHRKKLQDAVDANREKFVRFFKADEDGIGATSKIECSGTAYVVCESQSKCDKVCDTVKGFWMRGAFTVDPGQELDDTFLWKLDHSNPRCVLVKSTQAVAEPWRVTKQAIALGTEKPVPAAAKIRRSHIHGLLFEWMAEDVCVKSVQLPDDEQTRANLKRKVITADGQADGNWKALLHTLHLPGHVCLHRGTMVKVQPVATGQPVLLVEYKESQSVWGAVYCPGDSDEARLLENKILNASVVYTESWNTLHKPLRLPNGQLLNRGSRIRKEYPSDVIVDNADFEYECFVQVRKCLVEPPAILWQNFGNPWRQIQMRTAKGVFYTLLAFAAIVVFIIRPFKADILDPFAESGRGRPGALTQQVWGALFGIFNNILGAIMWQCNWGAGFGCWDQLNVRAYTFNVLVGIANNAFNIGNTLRFLPGAEYNSWTVADAPNEIRPSTEKEAYVADQLYEMLIPGWLFTGFFIGQLVGNLVPPLLNTLLLNIVFVWQWFPAWVNKLLALLIPGCPDHEKPLTARTAELIFTPGTLGIAWDHGNIVMTTSLIFASLFLFSDRAVHLFPWLLYYTLMIYWWHRLVTLKTKTKEMVTSTLLSQRAMIAWGLPLSMVAAALGLWGFRLGYWLRGGPIVCFVGSWVVYLYGFAIFGRPSADGPDIVDASFAEAQRKTIYTWFNTNPVHVLKSVYMPEDLPEASLAPIPFLYGKEHLLMDPTHASADAAVSARPGCKEYADFLFWIPKSLLNAVLAKLSWAIHAKWSKAFSGSREDPLEEALMASTGTESFRGM